MSNSRKNALNLIVQTGKLGMPALKSIKSKINVRWQYTFSTCLPSDIVINAVMILSTSKANWDMIIWHLSLYLPLWYLPSLLRLSYFMSFFPWPWLEIKLPFCSQFSFFFLRSSYICIYNCTYVLCWMNVPKMLAHNCSDSFGCRYWVVTPNGIVCTISTIIWGVEHVHYSYSIRST